jgi:hypothetical protein
MGKLPVTTATFKDPPNRISFPIAVGADETFEQYVNIALLDQQIRAALGDRIWSVNQLRHHNEDGSLEYAVGVGFVTPPTPEEADQVEALVASHDPAGKTAEQQERFARDFDYDALRANVAAVLADAANGIALIDADLQSIAADISAFSQAATLNAAKPPLVDAMQIQQRILNRQRRIIQSLVYAVRVVRHIIG